MALFVATLFIAAFCCVFAAAACDAFKMEIPNALPLSVALFFFAAWAIEFASGSGEQFFAQPLWYHLVAGLAAFFVTFLLFALRVFGAGDAKLISACALWTGFQGLPVFLLWVTIMGAMLALLTLLLRKFKPKTPFSEESWIGRATNGEAVVPYGIAIAFGFAASMYGSVF